ncbi:RagB/SusD family nutrient uptake outer membrane protein [Pedobacter endophyticus]|uniref:RagB/SusD family nutrient uptake outer membrane protein n=1 Tax=Pedobacter endophyticus TaxID=2789740 RepID=A0A7U3Q5C9_9SPHI|nr:RagB/SusD family nutrient uptake outer membrane protein [Pedobacter endophyticus]QPH38877.1 RagB/SusD family nutrient uptake outer membrane protein [Pedobacter endophyticus]
MRKYTIILFAALTLSGMGCKKFLNIVPNDALSGNNFWQTRNDVETFTNGLYASLRRKIGSGFVPAGDLRSSYIATDDSYGTYLSRNDLRGLQASSGQWSGGWSFGSMTRWKPFYDIISSANLLYKQVDAVPSGVLSDADRKRYKAEAVFMRNLCYFFMVRLYGDIPYFTSDPGTNTIPRVPMVQVLNNCIADMEAVKADLPWSYTNPNLIGVRAMRGGAIALEMHMNLWAAGFDVDTNKPGYYNAVKQLGMELDSSKDYGLMAYTVEDNKRLFKGRTRESLFEIYQSFNNGEILSGYANIGFALSHYPLLGQSSFTKSRGYYEKEGLKNIFNDSEPDTRKSLWFENLFANNTSFQFKKFANVYLNGTSIRNDDDLIIFRLSDAYLLTAEALAELGEDDAAKGYLNRVRERAGAQAITSTSENLKDDIYFERVRELIGEGHFYYDLVRTKRILDAEFCKYPITVGAFNAGAWTWPIDASALTDNPAMTLNDYWR